MNYVNNFGNFFTHFYCKFLENIFFCFSEKNIFTLKIKGKDKKLIKT